jgi:cytochrome c-type biogenesis protein CcmE
MRVRARFFVGAGLIVLAIAYLIVSAIRTTSEYYLTVDEVIARQSQLGDQRLRIAGRVKPGTISWDSTTLTLRFDIVPIPDASVGPIKPVTAIDSRALRVICAGEPKPDMFAPDRDVIVEGTLDRAGLVTATQVLTSCPSKYKPKQAQ